MEASGLGGWVEGAHGVEVYKPAMSSSVNELFLHMMFFEGLAGILKGCSRVLLGMLVGVVDAYGLPTPPCFCSTRFTLLTIEFMRPHTRSMFASSDKMLPVVSVLSS